MSKLMLQQFSPGITVIRGMAAANDCGIYHDAEAEEMAEIERELTTLLDTASDATSPVQWLDLMARIGMVVFDLYVLQKETVK